MTGFEAIAHHNGWMMALLGACIVFSGLAVLSFVISQLPKLFSLFERQPAETVSVPPTEKPPTASEKTIEIPPLKSTEPAEIAKQIEPLASQLPETFQLSDLYRLCREHDLPHPHLSLSRLQREGILHPQGEGVFIWKSPDACAQEG